MHTINTDPRNIRHFKGNKYVSKWGHYLTLAEDRKTYIVNSISKNGKYSMVSYKGEMFYLHRLVYTLFSFGDLRAYKLTGESVQPKNGDWDNCGFGNLHVVKGGQGVKSKVNVWDIRRGYLDGCSIKELTEKYNVTEGHVRAVCNGFNNMPDWLCVL